MDAVAADPSHKFRVHRRAEIGEVLRPALKQADGIKIDVQRPKAPQIIARDILSSLLYQILFVAGRIFSTSFPARQRAKVLFAYCFFQEKVGYSPSFMATTLSTIASALSTMSTSFPPFPTGQALWGPLFI